MLYEVAVVNENRTIILESKGLYREKPEAVAYKNLHKYEVADDEEMVVIEKGLDSLENIPSAVYVKAQTFTNVIEDPSMDPPTKCVASTSIESIITQPQTISIPNQEGLEEGKAAVFRDDEYIDDSFTIYYPVASKKLLENKYSKDQLCKVAEKLAAEFKAEKVEKNFIYEIDNFDIERYL